MSLLAGSRDKRQRWQKLTGSHQLARRRHNLKRTEFGKGLQPEFLGKDQSVGITVGLVILIVIGQLKLGKELIDGVNVVRLAGTAVSLPSSGP